MKKKNKEFYFNDTCEASVKHNNGRCFYMEKEWNRIQHHSLKG